MWSEVTQNNPLALLVKFRDTPCTFERTEGTKMSEMLRKNTFDLSFDHFKQNTNSVPMNGIFFCGQHILYDAKKKI